MYTKLAIAFSLFTILFTAEAFGEEKPFTGVFEGQGRGCWGKLYVRAKTIEWNTPYSVCNKTSYSVLQSDLDSESPRIVFGLDRRSKYCRYQIIELSFDPNYPDYWLATGYQSRKDFDSRTSNTEEIRLRTLSCGVRPQ